MLVVDRIKWKEPYSVTRQYAMIELRKSGVFRLRAWIQTLALGFVILGVAIAGSIAAFPGIVIPWTQLGIGFVLYPASMLCLVVLSVYMPREVHVRRQYIQISSGSSIRITKDKLVRVILDNEDEIPMLHIESRARRGSILKRSVGVGEKVNLNELRALLRDLNDQLAANEQLTV